MSDQKHIVIDSKELCCGCTACYSACPKNAITMCEDEEGFQYPKVDKGKCVDCGLCVQKCPIHTGNHTPKTEHFFAVKHKQDDIRAASSSGGMFSALAEGIIGRNGIVYGAAYDAKFNVCHIRTTGEDWKKLRSSKYVQSDMGNTFSLVREDLRKGKEVLFTGTPCQVDGLNRYLAGVDTAKLLTVDLICHGVPSPKIWQAYLKGIKKKHKKQIGNINFRNKEGCGWHGSTLRIESPTGEVIVEQSQKEGFFFHLFFNHLIIRPSCFSCQYANLNRVGDITIGDYWGVENTHPELDDDKGLSLVMANTPKGRNAIEIASAHCDVVPISEEACMQPQLQAPARKYGGRDNFWWTYRNFGLKIAGKRARLLPVTKWESPMLFLIRIFHKARNLLKKILNL